MVPVVYQGRLFPRFECAETRKHAHPMTYAGGERKVRLCLSGGSFSASNQIPGGQASETMSQERIEAASPKRSPRDKATMVMPRKTASEVRANLSICNLAGGHQILFGAFRSLSAAGEIFHQIGGIGALIQPMLVAKATAER